VFSIWSAPISYKQGTVLECSQFCTGACGEWTSEREEPVLEVVARERLVKTQQPGKGFVGAVVICEFLEISGGTVITCTYESCV
jgi:hypothetical protein